METLNKFNKRASGYFSKIYLNRFQTRQTLRDNLLPKLKSGEVRVKYTTTESMEKTF